METKTFLIALALMLSLQTASLHATSVLDNAVSLANLSVSPNPVIAGGNATIRFQLYNSYGSWVNNLNLQAFGSYPILNASPQGSLDIAQVNPGLNPKYYTYKFAIPSTAPSGMYKVYFNSSYYALGAAEVISTASMPVSFYVQNKPVIKVITSSPQPAALYSGYNQTVRLQIQNAGYGTARNVSIAISGGQGVNLLSSINSFFISNLTRGSTVNESILVSSQNVGRVAISANVSYYSSTLGQRYSSVQVLNLSVAPAAQFSISSQDSGIGPGATDMPVSYVVRNTGTSDASELQLSLQTSYPITPVASTAYVGSLKQGASATVTFLVNVDSSGVPGNYPVTVYEQWKQPSGAVNQQFSGSNNYFVPVSASSSSASLTTAAAVVVVIAVAILFYRRRTAKKGKK